MSGEHPGQRRGPGPERQRVGVTQRQPEDRRRDGSFEREPCQVEGELVERLPADDPEHDHSSKQACGDEGARVDEEEPDHERDL